MSIKKYFEDEENKLDFYPPILCRQVAVNMIYNEELNKYIDYSIEINELLRQKAYLKECSKEYLKKYDNYKKYKKIYYSIETFKKMMKNKLPIEIILEIIRYI